MNKGEGNYQKEAEAEFKAKDENRAFPIRAGGGLPLFVQKI
jgi:hypothetical protein